MSMGQWDGVDTTTHRKNVVVREQPAEDVYGDGGRAEEVETEQYGGVCGLGRNDVRNGVAKGREAQLV